MNDDIGIYRQAYNYGNEVCLNVGAALENLSYKIVQVIYIVGYINFEYDLWAKRQTLFFHTWYALCTIKFSMCSRFFDRSMLLTSGSSQSGT